MGATWCLSARADEHRRAQMDSCPGFSAINHKSPSALCKHVLNPSSSNPYLILIVYPTVLNCRETEVLDRQQHGSGKRGWGWEEEESKEKGKKIPPFDTVKH